MLTKNTSKRWSSGLGRVAGNRGGLARASRFGPSRQRSGYRAHRGFLDWIDDIAAFWSWKAAHLAHVIAGHSMGGHLVLRAVAEQRVDADAVVLSRTDVGICRHCVPLPVMHGAAKMMARLGDRTRPAWKWSEKPGEIPQGDQF